MMLQTIEPANLPTMVRSSDPQSEDNSIIRAQEWLAATGTQPVMVHLGMMLTEWALGQAEVTACEDVKIHH